MVEVSGGTVSIHQDGLNTKGERERKKKKTSTEVVINRFHGLQFDLKVGTQSHN